MNSPIYHVALASEWERALDAGGPYTRSTIDQSLDEEGFIHCSFAEQLQGVLQTFYAGREDIVLLTIDPTALDVRVENGFPHIYEPLPVTAITSVSHGQIEPS